MLNFVQPQVAAHYFWMVLFSFVGALQVVAVRYRLRAIGLVPPAWPVWAGMLLGLGVAVAAFVWFAATTPGMLRPGPAGLEIGVLFAGAGLLGIFFCRLMAWIIGYSS